MRIFAFLVLIVGVAIAGGAVFNTTKFVDTQFGMMRTERQTVRVLAAKVQLAPSTRLSANQLRWIDWPADSVPSGVYTSTAELFGADGSDKRYVTRTIEPNEPILEAMLSESGRIIDGEEGDRRIVSIRIDDVTGVSGFIAPGDHVDVMLTRNVSGKATTTVVMQDIEVVAMDQNANQEAGAPKTAHTATVSVSMVQAQKLALAQNLGQITLSLIGAAGAKAQTAAPPVNEDDLSDLPKAVKEARKGVIVRRLGVPEKVELPQ